VLTLGLAMYVISFFLFATGPDHPGWADAVLALALPFEELTRAPGVHRAVSPAALALITITGLINVVFIIAAIQQLLASASATFKAWSRRHRDDALLLGGIPHPRLESEGGIRTVDPWHARGAFLGPALVSPTTLGGVSHS